MREALHIPSWILSDNCEIIDKQLCTDLKDKNGTVIYEGDIFNTSSGNKFMVIFKNGCFLRQHVLDDCPSLPISINASQWEVVGNIYENPEHLQTKQVRENKHD